MCRSLVRPASWRAGVPLLAGLIALGSALADGVTVHFALLLAGLVTAALLLAASLLSIELQLRRMDGGAGDPGLPGQPGELFALMQRSLLTRLVGAAGEAESSVCPLLLTVTQREIERLTELIRYLSAAGSLAYDGEDREWLLGLTRECALSMDAVSLSTVDLRGFSGGLWTADLGVRYLDAQREAIGRSVSVRRIFVFGAEDLADEKFLDIIELQRGLGIEVRMLDHQLIPEWLHPLIADFILFDRSIGYETTTTASDASRTESTRPAILRTRLTTAPGRVQALQKQFEQLWKAADPEHRTAG
jgi:hypothetical protein